ncbi:MAG: SDR family oxidoreductase [Saprospiraceae bacterium]|nr:SDR family oxidoreductase [Saprospiraceae bacterium]
MFNLKDKIAIITGGNSGIGNAIVHVFKEAGAIVHVLDINRPKQNSEISDSVIDHHCDVSDSSQVDDTIREIVHSHPIDILVNNAGIAHVGNVENTSDEDFDKIVDVNIRGIFNCSRACIPHMKEKGGIILNMASIAGSVGINDRFAYSMSKGAVLAMTYSMAKNYVDYGIRCNSISPARIHTPLVDEFIDKNYPGKEAEMFSRLSATQPMGRMGNPGEVAHLALYLCSDKATFITGTDFPIDGGFIKLNGD